VSRRFRSIPAHLAIDGAVYGFVIGGLFLMLSNRFEPGDPSFWLLEGIDVLGGSIAWTAFRVYWGTYLDARRRYAEAKVEARLVLEKIEYYRERGYLDGDDARKQSAEIRRWLSALRKEITHRGRSR
jgi:hypothetical protein